jgi:hypothetical protein
MDAKTILIKIYIVAVKLSFGEAAHGLLQNLFVSKIMRNPLYYYKNQNRNSLFWRTPCDFFLVSILQARVQHTERAIDFLTKELKVCSQKEAAERVFFVSAKECLQARCKEQQGLSLQSKYCYVYETRVPII